MDRNVSSPTFSQFVPLTLSPWGRAGLLLTGSYFLAALVGIAITRLPNELAAIWIADAFMTAVLIRREPRQWPVAMAAMLIGGVAANVVMGYGVLLGLGLTLGDMAEVLFAATVVRKWLGPDFGMNDGPLPYLRLQLIAAVLAPILGGVIGAAVLTFLKGAPFFGVWGSWCTANAIGAVLVLPIALTASPQALRRTFTGRGLVALVVTMAVAIAVTFLIAAKAPYPLVVAGLPLVVAAMWLAPLAMALVSGASLTTLIIAGFFGILPMIPGRDTSVATSISFYAALSIFTPFCISLLIEQLKRERVRIGESEQRFRNAMEHSAIGMALVGLDGRWLRVNRALADMLGYSVDEMRAMTFQEVTDPRDLARDLELRHRILIGEMDHYHVEKRYLRKDGSPVWVQLSNSVVREEATRAPLYFVAQIEDITDEKHAMAALEASESRWSFALDSARQGVWDLNLKTGTTFHSKSWKSILGYADKELPGNDPELWLKLMHPDDRDKIAAAERRHFEGGRGDEFEYEFRMRHKDGHWVWILDRGKVVERDEAGRPTRIIGTHTDITARKESEDQIHLLSERVQLATRAGGVGLWEYEFGTEAVWWDDRMRELYGYKEGAFQGTFADWAGRLHPEDRDHAIWVFEQALAGTRPYDTEFRIVLPGGEIRNLRAVAKVVRDKNGAPEKMLGTNWDTTENLHLHEALFEEKERLRITLESIGDAVISTDTDTRITFMNPVAEKLTGWTSEEALGRPLHTVFRVIDEQGDGPVDSDADAAQRGLKGLSRQDGVVLLSRTGERRDIRDSAAAVRTPAGEVVGTVLIFQDMTKAREMQRQLAHSASHDALTGLLNRASFEHELDVVCEERSEDSRGHALCFIDLDRFKTVNDTASHAAGDALLREIARVIKQNVRSHDVTARIGGDEFGLLLRDCPMDQAEIIGNKIIASIRSVPFAWDGRVYDVGASIGIAEVCGPAPVPGELLSQADTACYTAKSLGRDRVAIYEPGEDEALRDNSDLRIAANIRSAFEADRFRLYAQEIRALGDDHDVERRFELLLRLEDDNGEIVTPASFIPAAERYDLMSPIDRWVITTTFGRYGETIREAQDLSVSINLSPSSLNDPLLWPFLVDEMRACGVPHERVHFEIAESALINNMSGAGGLITNAREAGCKIVLDNFGTGLSSFSYLRRYPIDFLKIDGTLIHQVRGGGVDRTIVSSINDIAHRLGARTIAEWVEDEQTIEIVRKIGLDLAQGYAIARPAPFDEVLAAYAGSAPPLRAANG